MSAGGVSLGLANQFQGKIDSAQTDVANALRNGKGLTPFDALYEKLSTLTGDAKNTEIASYRDNNPYNFTGEAFSTFNTGAGLIRTELTAVRLSGTPRAASLEKVQQGLEMMESVLPTRTANTGASTSSSSSSATGSSTSAGSSASSSGTSSGGATASELLGMVKDVDSSADKYTLIKEAINKMQGGDTSTGSTSGSTSSSSSSSGTNGASNTSSTSNSGSSSGSGGTIDRASFDKLLSALDKVASAVNDLSTISNQAKGQILDKIADVLQAVQNLQSGSTAPSRSTVDPTVLSALSGLNEQVQQKLPEGATKKEVQNLIADILLLLDSQGGNSKSGTTALTSQLSNLLSTAKATGNESLINLINDLSNTVRSTSGTGN